MYTYIHICICIQWFFFLNRREFVSDFGPVGCIFSLLPRDGPMPRRTAGRAGRRAGARNIGRWLSAICLAIQTCSALKAAGVDVPNVRYASAGFVWFCGVGLCLRAFQKSFVSVRFYKGF